MAKNDFIGLLDDVRILRYDRPCDYDYTVFVLCNALRAGYDAVDFTAPISLGYKKI